MGGDAGDLALGVDIGGTKTRVGVVTATHRVLEVRETPTPARDGAAAVLAATAALGRELCGRWAGVAACGVGTAGVVDSAAGTVVASTDAIAGWPGTPVAATLAARLGRPVRVDNDVNAFALGEAAAGAGRGRAHVLAVMVGTGVGGAFLVDGRLWRGAHHNAGEVGHLPVPGFEDRPCACGGSGHLEGVAAGPAMAARYRRRAGDAVAFAEVARRAEAERQYRRHLLPAVREVPLLAARLGRDAVLVGAAELARRGTGAATVGGADRDGTREPRP